MAPPKINRNVALAALLLLVVMCVAIFAAFRFVEAERTRELAQWQIRLGIVADSRAQAITDWVDGQAATLQGLAENASLQVYLTELALAAGDQAAVTDAQVQAEYLTTLLTATAHQIALTAAQNFTRLVQVIEEALVQQPHTDHAADHVGGATVSLDGEHRLQQADHRGAATADDGAGKAT